MGEFNPDKIIRNTRITTFIAFILLIIFEIFMFYQEFSDFLGLMYHILTGIIILLLINFVFLPALKKRWIANPPKQATISKKRSAGIFISLFILGILIFIFGVISVVALLLGLYGLIYGEFIPPELLGPKFTSPSYPMPENVPPELVSYFSQIFTVGGIITLIITILLAYVFYRMWKKIK